MGIGIDSDSLRENSAHQVKLYSYSSYLVDFNSLVCDL